MDLLQRFDSLARVVCFSNFAERQESFRHESRSKEIFVFQLEDYDRVFHVSLFVCQRTASDCVVQVEVCHSRCRNKIRHCTHMLKISSNSGYRFSFCTCVLGSFTSANFSSGSSFTFTYESQLPGKQEEYCYVRNRPFEAPERPRYGLMHGEW